MTSEPYDYGEALRVCRKAMSSADPAMRSTVTLAKTVVREVREEFPPEELEGVARAMVFATACVGTHLAMMRDTPAAHLFLASTMLNIQACAGVLILDELEIEQLEASLRASS